MISMTGYASLEELRGNYRIAVTLKSLNSRFLEVYPEIPQYLGAYESDMIKMVSDRVSRGKVKLSVSIKELEKDLTVTLDKNTFKKYFEELSETISQVNMEDRVRLEHILGLEGVMNVERVRNAELIWKEVSAMMENCLSVMMEQKLSEGKQTLDSILELLKLMENDLENVKELIPLSQEENRNRVLKKLNDMLSERFDEERILMEASILSSRMDINEEVERLGFHIKAFSDCCVNEAVVGKKLDFISQEMLREINTFGSKANNYDIASLAVSLKSHLEKIKEQIRNVE